MAIHNKVISVIGAQGGSVVRSLIQNPQFEVRCITRNKSSPQAKELALLGASVVQADTTNTAVLEQALSGSWGLFMNVLTEETTLDVGTQQGIGMLASAAAAGVKHVVYSSAPHSERLTSGTCLAKHLDVKARIECWGRANPSFETFTPVMISWYMDNFCNPDFGMFFGGFPFKKDEDGVLTCRMPLSGGDETLPWLHVENDFGDIVHGIFLNPQRWNQRVIQCTGDLLSWEGIVSAFTKGTGQKARFQPYMLVSDMPTHGWEGIRELFVYSQLRDGEYFGNAPNEVSTAQYLKTAAFKAKGGKGRESLTTVKEFFEQKEVLRVVLENQW
ncbi:hypothetical protein AOCH_000482 [Aspergillus ochraceoroseus]|uniref:NmrA-like domain-containing protein n=1 Tax=Aspergillus ochraceoroseus TaxID=138278 RepID=A0A0F8U030_9EURO|nr:hypothetical protein AOCH_000482 [Aspergillus ochraceoroseus]